MFKKKTFLNCFEKKIRFLIPTLSRLFDENIQACEHEFVPVEFCPITFNIGRIFYKNSLKFCVDWSSTGRFQDITLPFSNRFEITLEDIVRIMKKKKQSNHLDFIKINRTLDKQTIKTYKKIRTQIFDIPFLMLFFQLRL